MCEGSLDLLVLWGLYSARRGEDCRGDARRPSRTPRWFLRKRCRGPHDQLRVSLVSQERTPEQSDSPTPKARVEDGLLAAHEFISAVTAWTGHEDDCDETLAAVNDALFALERL